MKSNREVFQEMREQEAQQQPPLIEEEKLIIKQPKKLSSLERRAAAYEMKVLNNRVRKFGAKRIFQEQEIKRSDLSEIETRPIHNHAKPLTDFQKLYHIPEISKETKDKHSKLIKDAFKKIRAKPRSI